MNYHLIADDNEINRMVIKFILEKNGYNTDEVDNGIKVLDKIIKNPNKFSIIWLDVDMPKMDGIDCTTKLKNELNYEGIIIGITGHVDYDSLTACKMVGMDNTLAKPITEDDLIKNINLFLK
jgi:osomolarity two-component system sensor histidine kinase SLN1